MSNAVVKKGVEEIALAKIKEYQNAGMQLYEGFNPTNSLKKARFMLNDMKVGGKPVLEVCTASSIVQCLLESVSKGLDFSENQIYFIPRANQMTVMESVYGRIARAKRASKYYKPIVNFVHEGDEFEFGVNLATGMTEIKKHNTNLENQDKPFVAAYAYVTDNNGDTNVFVMTKKEWLTSWTKSPSKGAVAKEFERDMIYRTIIKKSTKSLVNTNMTTFGDASNSDDDDAALLRSQNEAQQYEDADYEEVDEQPIDAPSTEAPAEENEKTPAKEVDDDF